MSEKRAVGMVAGLQVGKPQVLGIEGHLEPQKRAWITGFVKTPVSGPLWLGATNLAGDGQADLRNHGGVDKAVCVYPAAHYEFWEEFLKRNLTPGAFGENFTVTEMTENEVCLGDVYRVGEALVEVSQPRSPCWKLARYWGVKELALKVQQTGLTGWYLRVLEEGRVSCQDEFFLQRRPFPEWTLRETNNVMYNMEPTSPRNIDLADCPALGESWTLKLRQRVASGEHEGDSPRLLGPEALR